LDRDKARLPLPTVQELVARKEGSRANPKILDNEVLYLLKSCTLNKKQRKKLWHIVAHEKGFFDIYRCTIEKKLCEQGLRRTEATKKLYLTDIQKAQRYKLALSKKD
jgi:hypothetical protein